MNRTSLIAVAVALALASCSEQSPTSPSAVAGTDALANAAWDATTAVPATDATPTVGQSRESGPRNAMPTEAANYNVTLHPPNGAPSGWDKKHSMGVTIDPPFNMRSGGADIEYQPANGWTWPGQGPKIRVRGNSARIHCRTWSRSRRQYVDWASNHGSFNADEAVLYNGDPVGMTMEVFVNIDGEKYTSNAVDVCASY